MRDILHASETYRVSNTWFGEVYREQPRDRRSSDTRVREKRNLRWWLRHLERCMDDDGFVVGARPYIADASVYFCFGDVSDELKGGLNASGAESFGDRAATWRALHAESPRIARIVERFPALPGVREYIEGREPEAF